MIRTKNNRRKFLDFIPLSAEEWIDFDHLAGSFAVIQCKGKYLLCYNVWREQWEIPAGSREENETPMECAKRELYEETGQRVSKMAQLIRILFIILLCLSSNLFWKIRKHQRYFYGTCGRK